MTRFLRWWLLLSVCWMLSIALVTYVRYFELRHVDRAELLQRMSPEIREYIEASPVIHGLIVGSPPDDPCVWEPRMDKSERERLLRQWAETRIEKYPGSSEETQRVLAGLRESERLKELARAEVKRLCVIMERELKKRREALIWQASLAAFGPPVFSLLVGFAVFARRR